MDSTLDGLVDLDRCRVLDVGGTVFRAVVEGRPGPAGRDRRGGAPGFLVPAGVEALECRDLPLNAYYLPPGVR